MDTQLNSGHFLSLPRPDIVLGPPPGVPDTTTLAAHDFDVDTRTGFMPPQPPLARLPADWETWEATLDRAINQRLQLGETPDLSAEEREKSKLWRNQVRSLPILSITSLTDSEVDLRRAHHVLVWILHFYIHSSPPRTAPSPIVIPAPIALPLLQISSHLQLPPVLTYSDTVLYNWSLITSAAATATDTDTDTDQDTPRPALDNLRCQTLFSGTNDEAEFFLASARIELKGVDALDVMQDVMDEIFVGDELAVRRITAYLPALAEVVRELRELLLGVKRGCDPEVFYHKVRPWFRGVDSHSESAMAMKVGGAAGMGWAFEGIERDASLRVPEELSGPTAGQSTLIHALDVFLGVDQYSQRSSEPSSLVSASGASSGEPKPPRPNFMKRMQTYMPRHHRAFLAHLSTHSRPLRAFVERNSVGSDGAALKNAYNEAVLALKEFRDAHMQIVALYIVAPAARARREKGRDPNGGELKGTGGTNVVKFLRSVRERTTEAVLT